MVFLFFILVIIINILILFSKIIIEVENFNIGYEENIHINDKYKITIKMIILKKIQIVKKEYNKNKISKIKKKINIYDKIKKIKNKKIIHILKKNKKQNIAKIFVKKMLEIKNINLKIELGTKNAALTAMLNVLLSTILSNVLRMKIKNIKLANYKIIPIYNGQNKIKIDFEGIFAIKLRHIINIIYILIKEKGENKYERTSNRKSYDYSHE